VRLGAEAEMPLEEGWALFQLGRHLDVGDAARNEALARAEAIFTRIQAAHHLELTRAEMAERSG
jgi:hypothetical protein